MTEESTSLEIECQRAANYLSVLFTLIRKHREKSPVNFEQRIADLLKRDMDLESKRDGLLIATELFIKSTFNLAPEIVAAVDADLQTCGLEKLSVAQSKLASPLPPVNEKTGLPPYADAFFNAIHEKSKTDPLIGAKIGSKEVFQRVLELLRNDRGVHVESLLSALGALAGYACQAALRSIASYRGMDEKSSLVVLEVKDGRQFYFGDPLNELLIGTQYSVWGLAAGAAQKLGTTEFPNLNAMFSRIASEVGSESFGVPRVPPEHRGADVPLDYLIALWQPLHAVARLFCPDPGHWPILYGLAVQEAITAGKGARCQLSWPVGVNYPDRWKRGMLGLAFRF